MGKEKKLTLVLFVTIITISFIVHFRWFNSLSIITFGDWGFYYTNTLKDFVSIPYMWTTNGLGNINLTQSNYPPLLIMALLAKLNINFAISERIVYIIPYVVLSAASSFFLVKKITKLAIAGAIGSLVYCYNIYILIQNESIFTILVAVSIAPLIILFFIKTLEEKKFYLPILTGLLLFIAGSYEFRICYLISWIILFYSIYYFLIINSNYSIRSILKHVSFTAIPFIILAALNFYWIYPFLNLGLITNNPLFNRGLFGNGYLNIIQAINVTLPWWTGAFPTVFVIQPIHNYFWILPLAAFSGLFLMRKNKNVLFFGLLALLGILLSKQADFPFPNFYLYLYNHLPGFNAFREASKFFFITCIGYSVMVGAFISWIWNNFNQGNIWKKTIMYMIIGLVSIALLYNTKPFINGAFQASLIPRNTPSDYIILEDFIQSQNQFFRTYWVPFTSRWTYYNNLHPKVASYDLIANEWSSLNQYPTVEPSLYHNILKILDQSFSQDLLNAASIKYVIVPIADIPIDDAIYNSGDPKYGTRKAFYSGLDKIPYLKRINIDTKELVVYENLGFVPNSYITLAQKGNLTYQIDNPKQLKAFDIIPDKIPCTSEIYNKIPTISHEKTCTFITYPVEPDSKYALAFKYKNELNITSFYDEIYSDSQTLNFSSSIEDKSVVEYFTKETTKTITLIFVSNKQINNLSFQGKLVRMNQIYNKSFFPLETPDDKAYVNYEIINPTKKTFQIKNATQKILLSMSETSNPEWDLRIVNSGQSATLSRDLHTTLYNSFNGWHIDPAEICINQNLCQKNEDGTYNISGEIVYTPQNNANTGIIISIIAGILTITLLLIFLKVEKPLNPKKVYLDSNEILQETFNKSKIFLNISRNFIQKHWLVILIILVGIILRYVVSLRGYHWDFRNFAFERNIILEGDSVYARTGSYNYGPGLFTLMTPLAYLSTLWDNYFQAFRVMFIGMLTLGDIGIFFILKKKAGLIPACLYYLNPISIIITGYHNQFDNLGLFLGLLATIYIDKGMEKNKSVKKFNKEEIIGIILMSISLIVKHLFIIFPIWIGMKQKGLWKKIIFTTVPLIAFFASFLPWWAESKDNIIHMVFLYRSNGNAPFWNLFIPEIIKTYIPSFAIFIGALIVGAYIFRKKKVFESALFYTVIFCIFSSAMDGYHMVILLPFIALHFNFIFAYLQILVTTFFVFSADELHFSPTPPSFWHPKTYTVFMILMILGFIYNYIRKPLFKILHFNKK